MDEIDAMVEDFKQESAADRAPSQLRFSHNGNPQVQPASSNNGLEGFGGIVGVGFGGKKAN